MGIRTTLNYFGGAAEVEIRDGRGADLPGWQECGFELQRHASAVTDWDDEDQITGVHYAELEAFAQELTGADVTRVQRHIRRNPQAAAQHHDLAPITLVHSDFADSYGDLLRKEDEAVAAARRVVILQFWRNVGPAKMDLPLAFCDARDVPRSQIRAFPVTNYAGGGIDFEALGIAPPKQAEDHHWYAFLELQPDEVVAFRTYDSDLVGRGHGAAPYWTPHSAFRDPEVELGRPSRSSIEARATCLFN